MKSSNNPGPENGPQHHQGKALKLTRKQKAFADTLLADPKKSATKAVKETYNVTTDNSAAVQAHENLSNPKVMQYLNAHASEAELVVIQAMKAEKTLVAAGQGVVGTEPDHAIRLRAADSILDRVHGKATQKIESKGVYVHAVYNLTGSDSTPPPEILAELEDD